MKKIFLLAVIGFSCFSLSGQTFSTPFDTVSASTMTTVTMHNDITNISASDIQVTWRVTNHNLPADWASSFAICDNNLCYYNINNSLLGGNSYTTDPIAPTTTGNFYVLPDLTMSTTTGTYFVEIRMTQGPYAKMSWYMITKFPTSVTSVTSSDVDMIVFPNPATNTVTILSGENLKATSIFISDLTGKVITKERINSLTTTISLEGYPSGMYIVQFVGNDNQVIGVNKFTKL